VGTYERQHIEGFIHRAKRNGFCLPDLSLIIRLKCLSSEVSHSSSNDAVSGGHKPFRLARCMKASIRCGTYVDVNHHKALEAFSSMVRTTDDLNSDVIQTVRTALSPHKEELMTSRTCSAADGPFVHVTSRTVSDVTRAIAGLPSF